MAYNNYFPQSNYQQPYYPQYQQVQPVQQVQVPTPQPQANSIIWIQGEGAARSYLLAPNSSVVLFDSDEPMFYIKTSDQTGMPNLRKFRFEEITQSDTKVVESTAHEIDTSMFVTRDELEERLAKITAPKATVKTTATKG